MAMPVSSTSASASCPTLSRYPSGICNDVSDGGCTGGGGGGCAGGGSGGGCAGGGGGGTSISGGIRLIL